MRPDNYACRLPLRLAVMVENLVLVLAGAISANAEQIWRMRVFGRNIDHNQPSSISSPSGPAVVSQPNSRYAAPHIHLSFGAGSKRAQI